MPLQIVPVFVSSTWLDLRPEREAVFDAVLRLRETKFVGMEYFGSRDETTRFASLNEVDHSRLYVGIFAARYATVRLPEGEEELRSIYRSLLGGQRALLLMDDAAGRE
jgi:Domain of unknown function (DUF4062)